MTACFTTDDWREGWDDAVRPVEVEVVVVVAAPTPSVRVDVIGSTVAVAIIGSIAA